MNAARKDGSLAYSSVGKVDPEIEGYNGKGWDMPGRTIDGDPFAREFTHSMGNVTTQTERGYVSNVGMHGITNNGAGYSVEQRSPLQQGDLATGGTLNVATEGMDIGQIPLGALKDMMGFGGGNTGKNYTPSDTWKDGKFQMADLYDYSKMHPWLWKILKGAGNMILPGSASIGDAVVQYGVPRGVGDGKPNNASIHRVR